MVGGIISTGENNGSVTNVFLYRWSSFPDKKAGNKIASICESFGANVSESEKKLSMEIVIKLGKLRSNPNPMDGKQTLTILNG